MHRRTMNTRKDSYLLRLPSALRAMLKRKRKSSNIQRWDWDGTLVGYRDPSSNYANAHVWLNICKCEMPNLIKWYYLRHRFSDFRYNPLDDRIMDSLFEWNSEKLIGWFLRSGDIRLLRDLASAAVRTGHLDLVKQILAIFDRDSPGYIATKWSSNVTSDAAEESQWDTLTYLVSRGFYMDEKARSIIELHMGDNYVKYVEIMSLHCVNITRIPVPFPED